MSQVNANAIYDASGGNAAKLYGSSMRYGGTAFVNRVINGDMRIDQRNAGASVTPTTNAYTLDRWAANISQASKFSVQRNAGAVTPPAGFTNYLGVTSLSAYSVGASEQFNLQQGIEGFNTADLGWGTANAQAVTLSFWVRSSLTGTFGGSLSNNAINRSYPFAYSIIAANTWEQKTITIPGDTSGTWLTDNSVGIRLYLGLGVGSTLSGTAGAWAGSYFVSATGAVSVVGTNGATFYITGVQLEAGTVATPFERRPYGTELQLCQRYFEKSYRQDITPGTNNGAGCAFIYVQTSTSQFTNGGTHCSFKTVKRTTPTINLFSSTGVSGSISDDNAGITRLGVADNVGDSGFRTYLASTMPATPALNFTWQWTASAEL